MSSDLRDISALLDAHVETFSQLAREADQLIADGLDGSGFDCLADCSLDEARSYLRVLNLAWAAIQPLPEV